MTVRLIPVFDKNDRDLLSANVRIEIYGGLGDIFNHIYWHSCYGDLEDLPEDKRAFILISSHNPAAMEVFLHHRKAAQFTICSPGFFPNFTDKPWRAAMGLDKVPCTHKVASKNPVVFYPPVHELPEIKKAQSQGKYIVMAAMASDTGRSIPPLVAASITRRCVARGYKVVFVGKDYLYQLAGRPGVNQRREFRMPGEPGVIDTINLLSVPSVAKLVEGAAGVVTCHSSMLMLSWHMRRPTFLACDDLCYNLYWPKTPGGKYEGYAFGGGYPENVSVRSTLYKPEQLDGWMEKLKP